MLGAPTPAHAAPASSTSTAAALDCAPPRPNPSVEVPLRCSPLAPWTLALLLAPLARLDSAMLGSPAGLELLECAEDSEAALEAADAWCWPNCAAPTADGCLPTAALELLLPMECPGTCSPTLASCCFSAALRARCLQELLNWQAASSSAFRASMSAPAPHSSRVLHAPNREGYCYERHSCRFA